MDCPSLVHLQVVQWSGCHVLFTALLTHPVNLHTSSSQVGQQAPGLYVGLAQNGLAQRILLQSVSHVPQHSPGETMGLGQDGIIHVTALQSCLQVLQPLQSTGLGQKWSGHETFGVSVSILSVSSMHDGQQAPGLCVWLLTGQSRGAQSAISVQSPWHCPQHSPGGMIGLGQEGTGQRVTLQSCLHVLQQSHLIMGTGQNVSGHRSVELPQGTEGGGRVISIGRPLWEGQVKQHSLL